MVFDAGLKPTEMFVNQRGRGKKQDETHEPECSRKEINGTDVKTHGYAVTHNTFLQYFIWTVLYMFPLLPVCSVEWKV